MNKLYILTISLLVLLLLAQRSCNSKQVAAMQTQYDLQVADYTMLQQEANRKGDSIASLTALTYSQESAINQLSDSLFAVKRKLGNTLALYQGVQRMRIDTVLVPYINTSVKLLPPVITDSFARHNMIAVPASFAVDDPHYSIAGTVERSGVRINAFEATDSIALRFVEGRVRLFKPRDVEAQVMNSNPYVSMLAGKSAIYKAKGNWFPVVSAAIAAFVAGLLIHQ